jgi:hypothetical protein
MKFKQVILIVAISSGSALASVWGYSKFAHKEIVSYSIGLKGACQLCRIF